MWHSLRLICIAFAVLPGVLHCLKDVELRIEPRIVHRGDEATLTCTFDLEDSPLYTVKWYRGRHEFYRYTPKEHPSTKIFPFGAIDVNEDRSNEHQVVVRNVDFNLSGNFSCEVTTDAPSFLTKYAFEQMLVVVLPNGVPNLVTDKKSYEPGDTLRANCSAQPSRPAAVLQYSLNNVAVCKQCETRKHTSGELWWSELSLALPLFAKHFSTGRLVLRCTAQVADIYQQYTDVVLYDESGPVPERVTSPNSATTATPVFFAGVAVIVLKVAFL